MQNVVLPAVPSPGEERFLGEVESIGGTALALIAGIHTKPGESIRAAAALACTVAELFTASLAVLRSPAPSHAMTLARSMLDAYADMSILIGDGAHLERLQLASCRNVVDVVEGFMSDDETRGDVKPEMLRKAREAQQIVERLTRKGVKTDTGEEKFRRAGLLKLYCAFQVACSSTHNDLTTLDARHVREDGLGIFESMSRPTMKSVCGIVLAILFQTIDRMSEISDLSRDRATAVMNELDGRWNAAAGRFLDE